MLAHIEPFFLMPLLLLEASSSFLPELSLFPEVSIPSRGLRSFLKAPPRLCGCTQALVQEQKDWEDGYQRSKLFPQCLAGQRWGALLFFRGCS